MFLVFAFGGDGVIAVNTDFADSNADGENVLLEFTLVGTNVVLWFGFDDEGETVILFGIGDDLAVWNDPAESFFSSKFWGNDLNKTKYVVVPFNYDCNTGNF